MDKHKNVLDVLEHSDDVLTETPEMKNLILHCENDDNIYSVPDKMCDSHGHNIYAYVTLVMMGDSYIPAAIVLAKSLINCGSRADKVVLVTNDVSEEGRRILKQYYDVVKEVSYVNIEHWHVKKDAMRRYLNMLFTRLHALNLVQYKKIILIDADTIVLQHPDHLFTLDTPAGYFIDQSITSNNIDAWEKICSNTYGELIPSNITDSVKSDYDIAGISNKLLVLTPKVGEFDDIVMNISSGITKALIENKFNYPDQQYLTLRYSGKWHQVNPRFIGLNGYPHWKILFGIQFDEKPFALKI